MSEISIILVRHGEASASWGDDPDPGLSKIGIDQANKLIDNKNLPYLLEYDFVSSPKSRALMTAAPLINKYSKNLITDETFTEIPSTGIKPQNKKDWLSEIVTMKLSDLPDEVNEWRLMLIEKIFETKKNTIVFSHFMVINALVAELTKSDTLLCFYPDYTSITKIIVEDNKVKDLYIGNERKTLINL